MVTKLHSKQRWLPTSSVPGSTTGKATVKFADIPTSTHSLTSKSVSVSTTSGLRPKSAINLSSVGKLSSSQNCHSSRLARTRQRSLDVTTTSFWNCQGLGQSTCDDIVLGGWVKGGNHRRALNYEHHGYQCWVNGLESFQHSQYLSFQIIIRNKVFFSLYVNISSAPHFFCSYKMLH